MCSQGSKKMPSIILPLSMLHSHWLLMVKGKSRSLIITYYSAEQETTLSSVHVISLSAIPSSYSNFWKSISETFQNKSSLFNNIFSTSVKRKYCHINAWAPWCNLVGMFWSKYTICSWMKRVSGCLCVHTKRSHCCSLWYINTTFIMTLYITNGNLCWKWFPASAYLITPVHTVPYSIGILWGRFVSADGSPL